MIFTFYSYKGGVGRSMALANIAELFYRDGLRVLMIDWDLEAPGLESFFLEKEAIDNSLQHSGLADMIRDYKEYMIKPGLTEAEEESAFFPLPGKGIEEYLFKVYEKKEKERWGELWLLPAGRRDVHHIKEYTSFVRSFDWLDFYDKWHGGEFFEWLRQQVEELVDVILIDSRTGLSEMGGVCTYQLADAVVMFCTPNNQSLDGVWNMANHLKSPEVQEVRKENGRLPLEVVVIPSRIEDRAEQDELEEFQSEFLSKFGTSDFWIKSLSWLDRLTWEKGFLWKLKIPYIPHYSFGEEIAVKGELAKGEDLRKAYLLIASLLTWLAPKDSALSRISLRGEILACLPIDSPMALPEDSEMFNWLEVVGLKENPFRYQYAEDDPHLSAYFWRFPELQTVTTNDLIRERKTWVFYGKEGNGKTALRRFMAARGRPENPKTDFLCLEYDQTKFEQLLAEADDLSEFRSDFMRSIFVNALGSADMKSSNMPISWQSISDSQKNLASLSKLLQDKGIQRVLCLVDPVKESFTWQGSLVTTSSLLAPILTFPDIGWINFRFFIPVAVKDEWQSTLARLPFNQCRLMEIKWDEAALKDLLGKRMTILSQDQTAPYRSLGELCEDERDFSSLVDAEMASLAQGSPRGAIWLANRLIELHCQKSPTPRRIAPKTWDMVKMAWWARGESRVLGVSDYDIFRMLGERIFYKNQAIVLQERSDKLLKCLVQAKGGFRSKGELIRAGWPTENQAGITEKALSQAMLRMKEDLNQELKDKGFEASDWIRSVRGRGYRLRHPGLKEVEEDGENG